MSHLLRDLFCALRRNSIEGKEGRDQLKGMRGVDAGCLYSWPSRISVSGIVLQESRPRAGNVSMTPVFEYLKLRLIVAYEGQAQTYETHFTNCDRARRWFDSGLLADVSPTLYEIGSQR